MSTSISKTILLPYSFIRGNVVQRCKKSLDFTDKFYDAIIQEFKSDKTKKKNSVIERIINSILPGKVYLKVKNAQLDDLSDAVFSLNGAKTDNQSYQIIINSKNDYIKIQNLPTIIHEIQHLFGCLYNPKYISREFNVLNKNKVSNFYDKYIYDEYFTNDIIKRSNYLKHIKRKLEQFINKQDEKERINLLQYFRYLLLDEAIAYKVQKRYAYMLKSNKYSIFKEDLYERCKYFMFDEKIAIIKEIFLKEINRQRAKIQSRN